MKRAVLTVERVKLDRSGYDKRGRYWGIGKRLYRAIVEGENGEYLLDEYARADSLSEARKSVMHNIGRDRGLVIVPSKRRFRQYGPTRRHMKRARRQPLAKLHG